MGCYFNGWVIMVLTSYQGETPDHEQTWTPSFITGPTRNDDESDDKTELHYCST